VSETIPRKPLISGNWKMHHNHFEAIQTVQKLAFVLGKDDYDAVDVSVHPPFTDLRSVQITLADQKATDINLGAQNCHWEDKGAFTGEISPAFLAKLDCTYVIAGHSERRELFGETDDMVHKKVQAILRHEMTPILCVGETLEEREAGTTEAKVVGQVEQGLAGLKAEQIAGLVVAYEPIWAIGTGRTATPDDAQAVCALIRSTISGRSGAETAAGVRVQYGGSVKSDNIAELMAQPDIDGALVGGASLDADEFARIVQYRQR
jgi:triosephosphate isomerase